MKLSVIIHKADEGGYWAEVPALPGCVTEGETLKEVKANLAEAIQGWLKAAENKARQQAESIRKKLRSKRGIGGANTGRRRPSTKRPHSEKPSLILEAIEV